MHGGGFYSLPRGLRAPGRPAGTFCVNKKYPKSHLNLRFKDPFSALPVRQSLGEDQRAVRRGFWIGEASELPDLLLPLWYLQNSGCRPFKGVLRCKGHTF